ncbi:MAG: pyridoxal 5'-phosphate synthase lyase subunit PdxS, partial [Candidatus Hydrothermarchaeales archaeon]
SIMMQLGADGIFVGSGIFKSEDPTSMAKNIVLATAHYDDPKVLAEVSKGLGEAMKGLDIRTLKEEELLQTRGV